MRERVPDRIVESLERRRLFASVLTGGTLTITGTDGQDIVTVELINGGADVRVDWAGGAPNEVFNAGDVTAITMNGGEGGDRLRNNTPIPSTINGGPGVDFLDGGSGNDRLNGGDNSDDMDGHGGDDILDGGDGGDIQRGGAGSDTFINLRDGDRDECDGGEDINGQDRDTAGSDGWDAIDENVDGSVEEWIGIAGYGYGYGS